MMNALAQRTKNVLNNEKGASNIEIIVWIGVVLLIAIVLIAFGKQIKGFLTTSGGKVDKMNEGVDKLNPTLG